MKMKHFNLLNLLLLLTILAGWYLTASVIQPFLHYNFQQIGFNTGIDFFKSFLSYPGGLADYVADFIAQFFSFNAFGSFLIVAVASLQGFIALSIVNRLAGKIKLQYSFFALILLFGILVFCDYRYPFYASIRLLFAFIFTWAFCFIQNKNPKFGLAAWFVLAILLFYLASSAALLIYALSTALIVLITCKKAWYFIFVPVSLIAAGLLPYLGYRFIFLMSLPNLYRITLVRPPAMLAYTAEFSLYIYYSLLPVVLFFVFIFLKLSHHARKSQKKENKAVTKLAFYKQIPFLISIQVIGCLALAYFLIQKSYNPLKRAILTIEYYAEHEQWADVLKTSKEIKGYDFKVNFQVNRALSHLGQLPDRLFDYPQLLGAQGLFVDGTTAGSITMPTSDLYFDLGYMSESQRWAFEAQTLLPNSPRILKRLIMISLIKRQYEVAGDFLKILNQNMLYRNWVNKYQSYISDTARASADPMIAEKRCFTPKKTVVNSGAFENLKLLVETNPNNRMAYDYLLTYCILDSHFPQFIEYLEHYSRYGIKTLPKSWEEALALYISKTRTAPGFVSPRLISENCIKRFMSFNKAARQYGSDSNSGKTDLFMDFGNTYWYYILFLSPKVTNAFQNKIEVQ
jgi:hypothetical protein